MHREIIAKVKGEIPDGTLLTVLIPDESLTDTLKKLLVNGVLKGELRIDDGRRITAGQRKKAYAIISEISDWNGDLPEWLKEFLKLDYMIDTGESHFSLRNCSVSTARDFISHLIDFAVKHGVPLSEHPIHRTELIDRYLNSCLIHKKCAVCGKEAHLHHVTRVGMGRDRETISHVGMKVMALCPICHNTCHTMPQAEFDELHHIYGIAANLKICEVWGLNYCTKNHSVTAK